MQCSNGMLISVCALNIPTSIWKDFSSGRFRWKSSKRHPINIHAKPNLFCTAPLVLIDICRKTDSRPRGLSRPLSFTFPRTSTLSTLEKRTVLLLELRRLSPRTKTSVPLLGCAPCGRATGLHAHGSLYSLAITWEVPHRLVDEPHSVHLSTVLHHFFRIRTS
jgi:hypothetical protein